jgi:thiol-disulfide isomerase/thioredoxin
MIDLLNELKNEFPESKYIESAADDIVVAFKKAGEYKKALQFIKEYRTELSSYYFYYIASAINETGKNLDISKEISQMGIEKSQMDLAKSMDEKPNDLTKVEWDHERNWYLGMNQFSLGEALNKENNNEDAIPLLGKALKNTLDYYPQEKLINLYVKLLVNEKKYEKALDEMSELITDGNATALMDDLIKEAFVGKNGSEEGFESYKSELEGKAKRNMISDLKGKMMMEPSPNFTLTDLNGNKVKLSDLNGKTVVLDFWATWCGPCLRSFPGMKKAVEKYADNDKVKFLFINTWENVDNKKENAEQFIKKNNYPFHVLLDTNNEVVTKFKVSGIPTKFIIDKAGYIRFKSVGFNGNTDVMADEISEMISLIN